jgi:ribokinase
MNNKPSILVVGSINMDLVLQADRIPAPGESYFGTDYQYIPGGKGANQAAAASLMGADVSFVGRTGDDSHGSRVRTNLENQGISTGLVISDPDAPTGLAVIILEPSGQNRIMVYPGANMSIRADDLDPAFEREYDAVMMNFEIPDTILDEVCKKAAEASIPVIIDAGPAREIDLRRLGALEILSPNETETQALTGISCDTVTDAERAAKKLAEISDARHIVIKLGNRGALSLSEGAIRHHDTFDVEVIDTTAAGDAFTAGLSVRYLETGDLTEAIRYGNAAGSLAVTRLGAQPSLPRRSETEEFLAAL